MNSTPPLARPAPILTPLVDLAALDGIDGAVEALDAIHRHLAAGRPGPADAAGLVEVSALLVGLAAGLVPGVQLDRARMVWRALTRLARDLEPAA